MIYRTALISLPILASLMACADTPAIGLHNSTKSFTPNEQMSASDWTDPAEVDRVWQAALVRIPQSDGSVIKTTISDLSSVSEQISGKYPTVIYLHGCTGIWDGTIRRINFLARNGYAVVAPASFARLKYPKSCEPSTNQGGLYRRTLRMRWTDAGNAIEKARALPWVDGNNMFLMGLSQGGITTATFRSTQEKHKVNARVVEGWTCNAGWEEYRGIEAPEDQPVLTLLGKDDPWFQNEWTRGSCDPFLSKTNGSKSIVYTESPLRAEHELLEYDKPKQAVIRFLRSHRL
ncbi:MAG: hypothetical protein AAF557_19820 [Pseudomonadota bacterium]